jgi:hypothetical protein
MSKLFRVIIVVAALALIALVSSQVVQASWAPQQEASENVKEEAQPPQQELQAPEPGDTQPTTLGLQGTTRPPNCEGMTIVESGQYSVCGVAVVEVELKGNNVELTLALEAFPTDTGKVLAGTVNLQCLVDGEVHNGSHDEHAEPKLCFAAPPDKELEVKFYDEGAKAWVPVETTVADGRACALAFYSGKYILVEK